MKLNQFAIILGVLAVGSLLAALFGVAEQEQTKVWAGVIGAVILGGAAYWAARCA